MAKSIATSVELIKQFATNICKQYHVRSDRACEGLIGHFAPIVYHIIHHTILDPEGLVATLYSPNCYQFYGQDIPDTIKYDLPLPEKREYKPPTPSDKTYTMLHLTDMHLDLLYHEGGVADCVGEALCCREDSPSEDRNKSVLAGHWGEIYGKCNIPYSFAEAALKHISETHKNLDFILWTGDNVPHALWATSKDFNINNIRKSTELVKKYFPNTPIYPVLGNHEVHPVNMLVGFLFCL